MNIWTERVAIAMFLALAFSSTVSAADVEIIRDRWGVPHVYAENLADASFGLAYAQAEDGLEEILRHVVQARGEGARAFGPRHVEDDLLIRLFGIPEIDHEQGVGLLEGNHEAAIAVKTHRADVLRRSQPI